MKRSFSLIVVLIAMLAINGCSSISNSSYFQSRKNSYIASSNSQLLVVPPGLARNNIKDTYIIGEIKGRPGAKDVPPGMEQQGSQKGTAVPKAIYLPGISAKKISMTTMAGHPAIRLQQSMQHAWLIVGSGLQRQKIRILKADSQALSYLVQSQAVYRIHLQPLAADTLIFITDTKDNAIADDTSKRLLVLLSNGMQGKSTHLWSNIL